MVSENEVTYETSESNRKSFVPWLVLIVIIVLLCCCCAFIISGWFLGDIVLLTFEEIFGGYY